MTTRRVSRRQVFEVKVVYRRTKDRGQLTDTLIIERRVPERKGGQKPSSPVDVDIERLREQVFAGLVGPKKAVPKGTD